MSINSSRRTGKDHLTKPATQSQLARLKREEEEELWISGEELYTEGSSDEEDSKTPSRSYKTNKNQDSRNSSSSGKHHWVVSDDTKNSTERFNDRVDLNKSMNSNSEENSLSSSETTNSSIAESQHIQSNSSVRSDTTNVSILTDDMCSEMAQDDEEEEEEEQGLKDSEISWKVNRDRSMNLTWREDTTELKELKQLDYQEGFDCITQLRKKFRAEITKKDEEFIPNHLGISDVSLRDDNERNGTYLTHGVNEDKSRNVIALNDELEKQISEVQSLDAVIRKFDDNVENEIKETSLCQYKNRERLKEMLSNRPFETGRLAENTRRFFNLYTDYANVPDEKHKNTSSANQLASMEQKANAITAVHEQYVNEKLSKSRKKSTRFIRENKTLVTYHSTTSPIGTYEEERIATLLRDDTVDSSNEIVNSSSNPYCVNVDERNLLRELNVKLSVLQTDIARKNCKTYGKRGNAELSLSTCDTSTTNNTAIPTISTVSTISTLQNVDEAILTELVEDSKMVVASFTDIDKRRQIIPFSKEI